MIDKLVVKLLTLKAKLSSERGQDIMEYAVLTGGIAVVLVLALTFFTGGITDFFTGLGNFMTGLVP